MTVVNSCLHGMAPQYLQMHCKPTSRGQSPAGIFDPLTPVDWLFHAPERTTATAALLSKDLECGTVFLLNFIHQISDWQRSETDLRHSCSISYCYPGYQRICSFFPILRYINVFNIGWPLVWKTCKCQAISGKCQGLYWKSGNCEGKNLVREKLLKLFIVNCIFVSIQVFSRSLLCLKC